MANYREIVTKAVLAKGKVTTDVDYRSAEIDKLNKALGCWIINHEFIPEIINGRTAIKGSYEIHIWYGENNNSNTNLFKEKINFIDFVDIKFSYGDRLEPNHELKAFCSIYPSCEKLYIEGNSLMVEITREYTIDVIGETILTVQVNKTANGDILLEEEIDQNVNTNYINYK